MLRSHRSPVPATAKANGARSFHIAALAHVEFLAL